MGAGPLCAGPGLHLMGATDGPQQGWGAGDRQPWEVGDKETGPSRKEGERDQDRLGDWALPQLLLRDVG